MNKDLVNLGSSRMEGNAKKFKKGKVQGAPTKAKVVKDNQEKVKFQYDVVRNFNR